MKQTHLLRAALCASVTFGAGCDGDDGEGGGQVISNASLIKGQDGVASLALANNATVCSADATVCTPDNLSGRVFAAGAMLQSPQGGGGYNMTFLANSEGIIQDPSQESHPEGVLAFNLLNPVKFSGLISIPSEDNMPENPQINRVESYFDYIDATLTISGSGSTDLDGKHTIRTVFRKTATVDDVTGNELRVGEKLIKKDGETTFRWCDTSSCTHTTRPDSPLVSSTIVSAAAEAGQREGNGNYALYSIDFDAAFQVTYEQISDPSRLWTLTFNVTRALTFQNKISTYKTEAELVAGFELGYGSNSGGGVSNENKITSTLTIGEAGSAN